MSEWLYITLQHFAFITKDVAHLCSSKPTLHCSSNFEKMRDMGPFPGHMSQIHSNNKLEARSDCGYHDNQLLIFQWYLMLHGKAGIKSVSCVLMSSWLVMAGTVSSEALQVS